MKNILGTALVSCSFDPLTGFFRNGYCQTDNRDQGSHVVASVMSEQFLKFTKSVGNDLSTPNLVYKFPGLKPGDRWCLCALRWKEAYDVGSAPFVILEATHEKALDYIELSALLEMRYVEDLN